MFVKTKQSYFGSLRFLSFVFTSNHHILKQDLYPERQYPEYIYPENFIPNSLIPKIIYPESAYPENKNENEIES